ncbi:MAG: hypothetical protein ACYTG3_10595 [Planctomycetota bacterium]|jgi:predicted Rossmann fold nucleotide-binding protein DprA/Smf involved in DNA uptake
METAAWMALAWRNTLSRDERRQIALGPGPDPEAVPDDVLKREAEDLHQLEDLGVRVLTLLDPEYPTKLKEDGPLVLQVAGNPDLLDEEGVECLSGHKDLEDLDQRTVIVLSKGLLNAKTLLRALHDPIQNGTITLVTAEPPRATWNRLRAQRRDRLAQRLRAPEST